MLVNTMRCQESHIYMLNASVVKNINFMLKTAEQRGQETIYQPECGSSLVPSRSRLRRRIPKKEPQIAHTKFQQDQIAGLAPVADLRPKS